MAYRIRYQLNVDWIPPGMGLGLNIAPSTFPGMVAAGPAQTLAFFNSDSGSYPPNSNTFTAADVTNLLNSMTTDLSAQMNAVLTRVQNFSTGTG